MNRSLVVLAAAMLLTASCSRQDPPPAAAHPVALEPLDPALQQVARARGQAIATQAFAVLSSNLLQAVRQSGVSDALPFCSAQAIPLTALVAQTNDVVLRRVSHRSRNPKNLANPFEQALIREFQSELRSGKPPQPRIVPADAGTVSFYAPIVMGTNLCLKCHGQPETDIALEDLAVIRRLYPGDNAIGFALGDVRGLWRIDFARSSLETRR